MDTRIDFSGVTDSHLPWSQSNDFGHPCYRKFSGVRGWRAKTLARVQGLPWEIVIIIDSTLQHRASLHPENAKTFNHGKGYVIGHQWTNVVLVLGDMLIPLKPIPFYSKRYCQAHELAYHSEHERVVAYLRTLDLEDYIGSYDRREVLVAADSGYDNKKIEQAIADKGWHFIIALRKTRSVKSEALYLSTSPSRQWCHIDTFFRRHRRLKWDTIRLATSGNKRKRMDFRVRHTSGYLRSVGSVELVCSERRHRPDGRRKYLACNDLRATARQIVTGYRMRWAVELFQSQDIKFTWDAFFFLVGHNWGFFKGQHVVHFDRPIGMHHNLFHQQLDHCLAVLKA
jgi:hypothetical protein